MTRTFIISLALLLLGGCATWMQGPRDEQCWSSAHLPEHWYQVGVVKAEAYDDCVKAKTAAR